MSKRIKSTLFILFFLNIRYMSAVHRPMSISKIFLRTIHILFKPYHSKLMLFHRKMFILGKYLYVSHTLFILYLEGNHTLFGEKLYFICKFSSGNTGNFSDSYKLILLTAMLCFFLMYYHILKLFFFL